MTDCRHNWWLHEGRPTEAICRLCGSSALVTVPASRVEIVARMLREWVGGSGVVNNGPQEVAERIVAALSESDRDVLGWVVCDGAHVESLWDTREEAEYIAAYRDREDLRVWKVVADDGD